MCFAGLSAATATQAHTRHGFLSRWQPRIILPKLKVDSKLISDLLKRGKPANLHQLADKKVCRSKAKRLSRTRQKRSRSLVVSIPLSDRLRARICSGEAGAAAAEVEKTGRGAPSNQPRQEVGNGVNQPAKCSLDKSRCSQLTKRAVNFGRESIQEVPCDLEDGSSQSNLSPLVTCQNPLLLRIKLPSPTQKQACKPPRTRRYDRAGVTKAMRSSAAGKNDSAKLNQNHRLSKKLEHCASTGKKSKSTQAVVLDEEDEEERGDLGLVPIPESKSMASEAMNEPVTLVSEPLPQLMDSVAVEITSPQSELLDVVTVDQGGHVSEDEQVHVDMVKRRKKPAAASREGQPSERSKSKVSIGGVDRVLTL